MFVHVLPSHYFDSKCWHLYIDVQVKLSSWNIIRKIYFGFLFLWIKIKILMYSSTLRTAQRLHLNQIQWTLHYLTCGINSLLHSVNLIVFTLLLVHLILRISPHRSHHLRSHHLSLPLPFTPDLKLISFTNPFLHSHSYSFRTAFTDLNLYCIKGALALFVLVSFSYVC